MPEKPCRKFQLSPETKKQLSRIIREIQKDLDPECLSEQLRNLRPKGRDWGDK